MQRFYPILMLALLCASSAAGAAEQVHVRMHCSHLDDKCPPPPPPPSPPAPPVPPMPPVAPPAPPAPPHPAIPAVPAAAHAACAGKQPGSTLTWKLGEGETMGGVCVRHGDRMTFDLRSYDLDR